MAVLENITLHNNTPSILYRWWFHTKIDSTVHMDLVFFFMDPEIYGSWIWSCHVSYFITVSVLQLVTIINAMLIFLPQTSTTKLDLNDIIFSAFFVWSAEQALSKLLNFRHSFSIQHLQRKLPFDCMINTMLPIQKVIEPLCFKKDSTIPLPNALGQDDDDDIFVFLSHFH